MPTIFTKIINGEIPCYKIAEDEHYLAFLDISPLSKGHTLVVPKIETDYLFDIDDQHLAGLIIFSKKIAIAMKKAIDCNRIGVCVIGLEVPHAHIHLIPMNTVSDMNFARPKLQFPKSEMEQIAKNIIAFVPESEEENN